VGEGRAGPVAVEGVGGWLLRGEGGWRGGGSTACVLFA
jgi:hypothetical protein